MFVYNSTQTHSENGRTKVRRVTIKGKVGYKSITFRNKSGRVTKKVKKRLTRKEISCIQRCHFVPGLFTDCLHCLQ